MVSQLGFAPLSELRESRRSIALLFRYGALLFLFAWACRAYGQPPDTDAHSSRWEFTEQFIRAIWLHPIRVLDVNIAGAGPIHGVADDCEIHVGARLKDESVSDFAGVVLEPPNVCKDRRRTQGAWRSFYDGTAGLKCQADGFIRAWPEHLTSGGGASNPLHVMELHPLRALTCPGLTVDLREQLVVPPDLGYKTGRQIDTVLRTFRLWVRRMPHPDSDALNVVEFDYFTCLVQGNGEKCGFGLSGLHNFARLAVNVVGSTKRCSGGGGNGEAFRTIIGRARARSRTGSPLAQAHLTKLYALPGTQFYSDLGENCSPPGPPTKTEFDLVGIFTIDPLAVVKTLDRVTTDHLDGQWVEVAFPMAFIIFDNVPE